MVNRQRRVYPLQVRQSAGWADQWWPDMMTPRKKKKTWKMEVKINFIQFFFFVISCHCCGASGCTWGMPNWISRWVQMSAARIRFWHVLTVKCRGEEEAEEVEARNSRSLPRHLLQTSVVEATRIAQTHASSTVPHSMSKYSSLSPLFHCSSPAASVP